MSDINDRINKGFRILADEDEYVVSYNGTMLARIFAEPVRRLLAEDIPLAVSVPPDARKPSRMMRTLHETRSLAPREWVVLREYTMLSTARQTASDLRRGRRTAPPGYWEFTAGEVEGKTRHNDETGVDEQVYAVWGRYLGDTEKEAEKYRSDEFRPVNADEAVTKAGRRKKREASDT